MVAPCLTVEAPKVGKPIASILMRIHANGGNPSTKFVLSPVSNFWGGGGVYSRNPRLRKVEGFTVGFRV